MSLFEACQKADIDQVKSLIKEKHEINQLDDQGRTPLHYCCDHQNIDCANLLLEDNLIKESILNLQDNEGCSALHLACLNGNIIMVKYFCEQGANVKLVDNELHSLIHWITVCGHLDLFDILIQYQAPIHTSDIYGAFPIHYASQLCGNDDSIKSLAILKKLIGYNVDINCLDGQKRTPFIWAASAGAIDALRILYKAGAHPLHVDNESLSALHCAATREHTSCIRILVEFYGCPLEGEDINGCTPLFYAVTLQHSNSCRMLLDLKANPNHKDKRGRTPSHCAALKGNIDCLKYLIKYNADIWIKNKRGDYPIHEAINAISLFKLRNQIDDLSQLQKGCLNVVRYIFQLYPKKVNIQNDEHRTPLHLAASLGDITMCKILIECGARINSFIRTSAGNFITPYDLACIRHQDACAKYLAYNHGGQRGNLLANIQARRIQKFFRQYKIKNVSIVNQRQTLPTKIVQTNINKKLIKSKKFSTNSRTNSTDYLLNQAKLCLDNKIIEDRLKRYKANSSKPQTYLLNSPKVESTAQQRRHIFAKSKTTMKSISRSNNDDSISSDKIIIHKSNSISTSVKLYERHKLLAEELFKLKQARVHNDCIIINRPLYKILIENAFNPQNRHVEEIEKYLETLLKAYEIELEAIRKRTKSVSPRRIYNDDQRKTKSKLAMKDADANKITDNKDATTKSAEGRSTRKKSDAGSIANETDTLVKSGEKKKKPSKNPPDTNSTNREHRDEIKSLKSLEKENNAQAASIITDQEVPVKSKKKRAPKIETNNEDNEVLPTEEPIKKKKPKAPKPPSTDDYSQITKNPSIDESATYADVQPGEKKSKKPKAPKPPPTDDNSQITKNPSIDESATYADVQPGEKKPKKPKASKTLPTDEGFQDIENPAIEGTEPYVEVQHKEKKSKKSKKKLQATLNSYDVSQDLSHEDINFANAEFNDYSDGAVPDMSFEGLQQPENDISEHQQVLIDIYNNLQSKVDFAHYVGNDQWCIIHLPKSARSDQKSGIKKILPGGSKDKDAKGTGKTGNQKGNQKGGFFKRLRSGVSTLVRDENNMLFGEVSNFDMLDGEEYDDDIDTDDLHRYAQKLRELEDKDREINPEFLVLRDGKTVYGVHESDAEGKIKLATRKPIYDRSADQKPDEQAGKKKLLSRLKNPFTRNKSRNDDQAPKSANATPNVPVRRKSSRKSLNEDLTTMAADDSMMV